MRSDNWHDAKVSGRGLGLIFCFLGLLYPFASLLSFRQYHGYAGHLRNLLFRVRLSLRFLIILELGGWDGPRSARFYSLL